MAETSKGAAVVDEHTLEISKMLTVSTAHVSQTTASMLPVRASDMDNLEALHEWSPSFAREDGWLFFVISDIEALRLSYEGAPKDLFDVVLFAHEHGCEWLMFDSAGPVVEGLFQYEW